MSNYILSYQPKCVCPNHQEDKQDMWMLFDPTDHALKNSCCFLICKVCFRIAEITGNGGEVLPVSDFHRSVESK